jgi:hypothetical protein
VDYDYDIFLSYKRHRESRQWITEHFQPLLEYYVGEDASRMIAWRSLCFR